MTTVYITRHGETLWNTLGIMQGWKDSPLTEQGINQAKLLSKRLEEINFDIIFSSSCGRAFKTAEILRGAKNIKIIPKDNLREINMGHWEGLHQEDIKKIDGIELNNFWNKPHLYKSKKGETYLQVQERLVKELKSIVHSHKGKTILVVTHAVASNSIMNYYLKREVMNFWDPPRAYQTCLSKLEFHEDGCSVLMFNDIEHLHDNKPSAVMSY